MFRPRPRIDPIKLGMNRIEHIDSTVSHDGRD